MKPDKYDKLYTQLTELIPDLTTLQPGDYRKSEAPGFMALHMDVLSRTEDELRISLAHNYRQGGDTIPDPDMEIRIYLIEGWNKAEALTYQDTHIYKMVYWRNKGQVIMNPKLKKSLNAFLAQWLMILKNQGHSLPPPSDPLNSLDNLDTTPTTPDTAHATAQLQDIEAGI